MISIGKILSRSGGLVYHTRAALHRKLWSPTREFVTEQVKTWLKASFREPGRTLYIFGPSAAYLLDFSIFDSLPKNTKLVIVDPDFVAQLIFRWRCRSLDSQIKIEWSFDDQLLPFSSPHENTFSEFISRDENSSVLFFGLLGQIEFQSKIRSGQKARSLLLKALENKSWLSLHDVASCRLVNKNKANKKNVGFDRTDPKNIFGEAQRILSESSEATPHLSETLEDLAESVSKSGVSLCPDFQFESDWIDHDTEWIRSGRSRQRTPWFLTPTRFHILELVSETTALVVSD